MTTDRGAVLARIKALSAKTLANGCTRPEAAAAYAKASALMDAHGVCEAELRDEPVLPPPVFDHGQYAREREQATRDHEARQRREHRNGALGIAAVCLVAFGLLFAGNLIKLGPAEGLLQALWRTVSLIVVLVGGVAAMFSAPLLLRLAYCAARDRFGPDITTVGSAVLSGLIAAWIGLNYPVQTNGFFAFLQGAVLFCALVGVLGAVLVTVVGSPLSFFGRLKKAGEILFYRVSVGLTLALSLAGLVATLVELLGYRVF